MSPRFIRRDKGSGAGSAGEGPRGPKPSRLGSSRFGAPRSGAAFGGPRPEWRDDGERGGGERGGARRDERGADRGGESRRDGPRPAGGRYEPRRFEGRRSDPRKPEGSRFEGRRPEGRGVERRPFEGRSFEGRGVESRSSEGRSSEGRGAVGRGAEGGGYQSRRPEGRGPGADRFKAPRPDRFSSSGDRPYGERPRGNRFEAPPSEGRRIEGSWGEGSRPRGARPTGSRPIGARPVGGRFGRRGPEQSDAEHRGAYRPFAGRPGRTTFEGPDRPSGTSVAGVGPVGRTSETEFGAEPASGSERFGADPADDLIWGRHSAQATLESERPIHRIWCTPELRFSPKFLQLLREAKSSGVLVEEVTWARLGQLTGGAVHQGIVLQTAAAETFDLEALIEGCRSLEEPPLLMAVDGLTDPHNLGAIVRSAEALGAHGLVLPQRRSAGLTGSVAKVAAGALEHLPVARVVNLNRSLDTLKQEGYRVIGLAEEGSVSLTEATLDGPLVIVTGSESEGLSMLTRKHCDQLVRIPLRGATPSLNASVATALLLYEVARRGWMRQITGSAPAPRVVRPLLSTRPSKAIPGSAEPGAEAEVSHEAVANEAHLLQVPSGHVDSVEGDVLEADNQATQAWSLAPSAAVGKDPDPHARIHSDLPPNVAPDLPTVPGPAPQTSSPIDDELGDGVSTTDAAPQGVADSVSPGLESAWSAALATEATDPATTGATQSGPVVGEDIRF